MGKLRLREANPVLRVVEPESQVGSEGKAPAYGVWLSLHPKPRPHMGALFPGHSRKNHFGAEPVWQTLQTGFLRLLFQMRVAYERPCEESPGGKPRLDSGNQCLQKL